MAATTDKRSVSLHPLVWSTIILTVISVLLLLTALLLPPQGEVHPSVLQGLAIITADIALVNFAHAIATNKVATFKHGKTTATIGATKKSKSKPKNEPQDN